MGASGAVRSSLRAENVCSRGNSLNSAVCARGQTGGQQRGWRGASGLKVVQVVPERKGLDTER